MKIALCFLISYQHIINKEDIWIQWIKEIEDIVNIYIHYTDYSKIQSPWIKKWVLPDKYIAKTDYTHVVPAYMSLMYYASAADPTNKWFCFVTGSCCPIIPASEFRRRFFENHRKSIMTYKPIWWNPYLVNRANLLRLKPEYHLGNNPWFILSRDAVIKCLLYQKKNFLIYHLICNGPIANESIFAIMLSSQNILNNDNVINKEVFATDWKHMDSPTSPHTFRKGNTEEIDFIKEQKREKYIMFLRKVGCEFPDEVLKNYICEREHKRESENNIIKKCKSVILLFFILFSLSTLIFYQNLTFPSFTTFDTRYKCGHRFIC